MEGEMKKVLMVLVIGVIVLESAICDMVFTPDESYESLRGVKVEEIEKELAPDWSIWMWNEYGEDDSLYVERMQNGAEVTASLWYWNLLESFIVITDKYDISYSVSRQSNIREQRVDGYLLWDGADGDNYLWDIYLNEEEEQIKVDMVREVEKGGKKKLVYVNLIVSITSLIPLDTDMMVWLRDCIWEGESADRYRKSVGELYWHIVDLSRSGGR